MRNDIDQNSLVRLHLIGRVAWKHSSGPMIEAADYNGYRALTPSKERRFFLSLMPGDSSVDWLDITDHIGNFMVSEKDDAAPRLARKLRLKQNPGKDVIKDFGKRVRELRDAGQPADKAAIIAATEKFSAEFEPTRYDSLGEPIESILASIASL
jgi:hypothetical protein